MQRPFVYRYVVSIPVPAIVDPDIFETVQGQLDENRKRKRDGRRRPGWLLQGLVVCRQCGYAFYGKMARGTVGGRQPADYGYYRCTGTDAHKFGGQALCENRSVRSDKLEAAVWQQIETVLDDPQRVAGEHERRMAAASDGKAGGKVDALDRQIGQLRRGINRHHCGTSHHTADRGSPARGQRLVAAPAPLHADRGHGRTYTALPKGKTPIARSKQPDSACKRSLAVNGLDRQW